MFKIKFGEFAPEMPFTLPFEIKFGKHFTAPAFLAYFFLTCANIAFALCR